MSSAMLKLFLLAFTALLSAYLLQNTAVAGDAATPLRRHPTNPRYFTNDTGKAIFVSGSQAWYLIQGNPGKGITDISPQKWSEYLDFLQSRGHNFTRVWINIAYMPNHPSGVMLFPWQRTGPGVASDGAPKFDLTRFNQPYFDAVRERIQQVVSRGMYCSVMLYGSFNGFRDRANWPKIAWNPVNNINPEIAAALSTTDPYSFHTTNAAALDIQRMLVRKTVDTLNDINNLYWEIINEDDMPPSQTWQSNMVNYVKSYEQAKPRQHLVMMCLGGQAGNDNVHLYNSTADIISPRTGLPDYLENGGSATYTAKVVMADSDHHGGTAIHDAVYVDNIRKWFWKVFTRGCHSGFMDTAFNSSEPVALILDPARYAMGKTVSYAARFKDLAAMVPTSDTSQCSTGFCLRNPGVDYLAYQPGSGAFSVNLVAGTYTFEWLNGRTNTVAGSGTVTVGAGLRSFTPPFSGDAVLYLKVSSNQLPPPTIVAPAANQVFPNTTTTITATWNPVAGATNYKLRCKDLTGTSPYDPRNTWNAGAYLYIDGYTQTSITFNVIPGRSYRFWIHAANAGSTYSNPLSYSAEAVVHFSVSAPAAQLPAPTIVLPAANQIFASTTTSVTVSWNPVAGAAGYHLRCTDLTGKSPYDPRNTWNSTAFLFIDGWKQTSITFSVIAGRAYRFWLHAASPGFTYSNPLSYSAASSVSFSVAAAAASAALIADSDGDGLEDDYELGVGLDPLQADTDGNGIPDGAELVSGGALTHLHAQETWRAQKNGSATIAAAPKGALTVLNLSGRTGASSNVCSLTALLPAAIATGETVVLSVGSANATFVAGSKGICRAGANTLALKPSKDGTLIKARLNGATPAADPGTPAVTVRLLAGGTEYTQSVVVIPAGTARRFSYRLGGKQ